MPLLEKWTELDAILALAVIAQRYRLVRPIMVARPSLDDVNDYRPVLHVKQARHLVVQNIVDSYIPNDCFLNIGRILR